MLTVSYDKMAKKGHALVPDKEKQHMIKIMAHETLHVKDTCGKAQDKFCLKGKYVAKGKNFSNVKQIEKNETKFTGWTQRTKKERFRGRNLFKGGRLVTSKKNEFW